MDKSILVIDIWQISHEAAGRGYYVKFLDRGPEYDRRDFFLDEIENATKYDIIILEAGQNTAEELRKRIAPFKQKDTLICRCLWNDFWCEKGGVYQVSTINESFNDSAIIAARNPLFEGFDVADKRYEALRSGKVKSKI